MVPLTIEVVPSLNVDVQVDCGCLRGECHWRYVSNARYSVRKRIDLVIAVEGMFKEDMAQANMVRDRGAFLCSKSQ